MWMLLKFGMERIRYLFLSNIDAYAKWVSLLQEGHEIAASCGRDWHTETSAQEEVALFVY